MEEKYYENHLFQDIKLSNEELEFYEFIDCTFTECTLEDCTLVKCSFSNCRFSKCRFISIKAQYTQLKFAEFTGCNLIGIQWSEYLPAGKFADPVKKFHDCCFKYNTFSNMPLKKFDFSGSDIIDSMFTECELNESKFKKCNLERTEFFRCDIRKADFREASGYRIDIMSNKMKGSHFSFPEVVQLLGGLDIIID